MNSRVSRSATERTTRLLIGGQSLSRLMPGLVVLAFAGLCGALMYLRTGNLIVLIGIHTLVNAPSPIMETPFPPTIVIFALGLMLLAMWPYVNSQSPRWHHLEVVSAHDPSLAGAEK